MVILTNLSSILYEESRHRLNQSSQRFGIDMIRTYDFSDLKYTDFYKDNSAILGNRKGLGMWLWKSYIIMESLKAAANGDVIVYSDCGVEIIDYLSPLIDIAEKNSVVLFGNGDLKNSAWTKRDCFVKMGCDEEKYWMGLQVDASFCLFRKDYRSLYFVEQWLHFCKMSNVIDDEKNIMGFTNLPDFVEHRHDQSVLSLLAIKEDIELFRCPSQFGNHYKSIGYRVNAEFNCVSQACQVPKKYYHHIPYHNSPYPQLINHHRQRTLGFPDPMPTRTSKIWRIVKKKLNRYKNTLRFKLEQKTWTTHKPK